MDDNQVNIFVTDANDEPVDLYALDENGALQWNITFGDPAVSAGKSYQAPPYLNTRNTLINQYNIYFTSDRQKTVPVAIAYANAGYGINLPIGEEWPVPVELRTVATPSANMSVHGKYAQPKELNFYFPVQITTPAGFVMQLLLGQCGDSPDAFQVVMAAADAEGDLIQAGLEAEEDPLEAGVECVKAVMGLVDSLHGTNPWFMTFMGTEYGPVGVIPQIQIAGNTCSGLIGVGPTGTAGNKQVGCFFYNSDDKQGDYTFNVKIYNEKVG